VKKMWTYLRTHEARLPQAKKNQITNNDLLIGSVNSSL